MMLLHTLIDLKNSQFFILFLQQVGIAQDRPFFFECPTGIVDAHSQAGQYNSQKTQIIEELVVTEGTGCHDDHQSHLEVESHGVPALLVEEAPQNYQPKRQHYQGKVHIPSKLQQQNKRKLQQSQLPAQKRHHQSSEEQIKQSQRNDQIQIQSRSQALHKRNQHLHPKQRIEIDCHLHHRHDDLIGPESLYHHCQQTHQGVQDQSQESQHWRSEGTYVKEVESNIREILLEDVASGQEGEMRVDVEVVQDCQLEQHAQQLRVDVQEPIGVEGEEELEEPFFDELQSGLGLSSLHLNLSIPNQQKSIDHPLIYYPLFCFPSYKRITLQTIIQPSTMSQPSPQDYTLVQAGSIKKGDHCMLKGFPCLVTEAATTKNNKGAVKTTLAGNDIFTSKKYEEVCPASSTVQVPILKETQYEVADIDQDGFVSILLPDGNLKADLKLPEDDEGLRTAMKQSWDDNNANQKATIFFTIRSAGGFEKFASHRVTFEA